MTCKICGNTVSAGETTCSFCGSPVKADDLNITENNGQQQPESPEMFDMEDTLKIEKITYVEKKETDVTENKISDNNDMEMFPEIQSLNEQKTTKQRTKKVHNRNNNNIPIFVMAGTIFALVCFIVIILIFPRNNSVKQYETADMTENTYQSTETPLQESTKTPVKQNSENPQKSTEIPVLKQNDEVNQESNDIIKTSSNNIFTFPSDREYISEDDLMYKSKEEVAMMRNEIYARHGYIFHTEPYKSYFEAQPWYSPNQNFNDSLFNPIEKANKDFIVKYEKARGWR